MRPLTLNRRRIMLTALAGAAAPAGRATAQAAPPAPGNAGAYRFRIGDIRATVLSDGLIGGPPAVYAFDAPELELAEALRRAFLPADRLTLNLNTLLLETGGQRILVEAGAGQTMGPGGGRLFANLAALGLAPGDIDAVVVSHLHPDHVGNLRDASGGRAFPRATLHAPRADWAFFVEGDPDLSYMPVPAEFRQRFGAAIKSSLAPLRREVSFYEAGQDILPGLTSLPAAGHTPGMAALLVHSGAAQLLLTADLAYHPVVNIDRPWRPGPDRDPAAALASRQRIFGRAAAERLPVLGFHYPFPGLGHLLRTDQGHAWVPAAWQF
ncbi:hydrolase [Pseudoroseomonas deserti]|uniref:Hydrolase n=1 Tax=Teichococcus deserti TaxID=1817963 RepID=A0A1V2H3A1_9PROT|nr:MBL fold metallo-hydrolase [Pseudoroseomonas deserti]ONG54801.1 hydrolase [Pseudoroseomonas deserti]